MALVSLESGFFLISFYLANSWYSFLAICSYNLLKITICWNPEGDEGSRVVATLIADRKLDTGILSAIFHAYGSMVLQVIGIHYSRNIREKRSPVMMMWEREGGNEPGATLFFKNVKRLNG